MRGSLMDSVGEAANLLLQQGDQLPEFLTHHPRGQHFPTYLQRLADMLALEKREMSEELESLSKNIDHLKVIVALQLNLAGAGGVLEELDPRTLAEDAIEINRVALDRHQIQLTRDYQPLPRIIVDKHKALEILVNLVTNAKQALRSKPSDKRVVLSLSAPGPNRIRISVSDNGAGVAPENLTRIFSQGFTTRPDGHGFGLHNGAIAAHDLGGSLLVHSDGVGLGATFVLELPCSQPGKP